MVRPIVRSVLVLGSGPIKIAEAAEFDYSGSQALKALREEGIETILVNPNVATIQTSHKLADKVYLVPLKPHFVEKVIERERPDAILLGFGGQTALSLGVSLHRSGVLAKYGVKVLGTPIDGIEKALSRDKFRKTMIEYGLPVPPSMPAHSIEDALDAAEEIGYPVIVRVSFNLGGGGSFVAWSRRDLEKWLARAFAQSEVGEVLVEKYLHFWKEIEFEVVRDAYGNAAAITCMENVDPMGVHTGDSVVVAPCQTLTDHEYNETRMASIGVARAISLIGEGNVQLALDPKGTGKYYIIETNPRMSRSSALASKATGYPLAYIAAKLALGYKLHELLNKVTRRTCACFEPSLDYVVVKMPRWDLDKFDYVEKSIGSEMKSIGEVMAIGRTYIEALQKAIRMLDIGEPGLTGGPTYKARMELSQVLEKLRKREPYWPLWVAKAFALGATVEQIYEATGIDPYFLYPIQEVVQLSREIEEKGLQPSLVAEAKRMGFSDEQLALLIGSDLNSVRGERRRVVGDPVVKQIDTLAAEWPAETNYLYTTYHGSEDDIDFTSAKPKIIVLGAGVFRIGVSVEFDWAVVGFSEAARRRGYEVIVVNNNPETVSTDWDINEKLYFEELSLERILDIYVKEKPLGVVAFVGGQIANKLAPKLSANGVVLLGTKGESVDRAEDREKFSLLLDELGIKQPLWTSASSIRDVLAFAEDVGYPVLVRPSYVLSGSAMKIAYSPEDLIVYITMATRVSPEYPVVVSKFYDGAIEFEIDAVGDGKRVVGTVIEHIEPAGIHSGDSTMTLPPHSLPDTVVKEAGRIAETLNEVLEIKGPFNLQLLYHEGNVYVIELNLRASRSMPFTSKTVGVDLMELAAQAVLDGGLKNHDYGFNYLKPRAWGVKSPQFSWTRLRGSYPHLGPEMRSTGEAASLGMVFEEALLKSWLSIQGNEFPEKNKPIIVYDPTERSRILKEASWVFEEAGYTVLTVEGMEANGFTAVTYKRALELVRQKRIGLVVTTGYAPQRDYELRRTTVDMSIPILLNDRLAYALATALLWYSKNGDMEVRELREYWVGNGW